MALTEYVLLGIDAEQRSAGATEQGTALLLDGGSSGFEYALYRFNPAGEAPDSVSIVLEEELTTGAWIGLADYAAGRWEFSGPFTKQKTFVVDDAKYVSPGGNIWVAVLAREQSALVNALSVRTISPDNQPPSAEVQAIPTSGNAPLDVFFDASASTDADGTIIEYAWDFDGNGTYEEFSDTAQLSHVFADPGSVTVTLRVTDDQLERDTATVDINVNPADNLPPVASFSATPTDGDPGETSFLDASFSSDPDGSIVKYEWDLDGDGDYELDTGAIDNAQKVLPSSPGLYAVGLQVTDDDGATDTAGLTLTSQGWGAPQTLDSTGDVGVHNSLAVVNGRPAISYHDYFDGEFGNGDLKFVRASNSDGSAWGTPQTVDSAGIVGQHTTLAIVNGNPAISYSDGTNGDLKYVRASNADGSAWGAPLTLDSAGNVGSYTSLTVVNGNPAICYYDYNNQDLKYVRASNADGSAWDTSVTPDSGSVAVVATSLGVVNGFPAISYGDQNSVSVKYVRAADANGATWSAPLSLAFTLRGNFDTSLVVVNGKPAVSYDYGNGSTELRFLRASNADGSAWGSPQTIDTAGGSNSSLTIVNGTPAISYRGFNLYYDLRYVRATNADGSAWGAPQMLDSGEDTGFYTSLAVVSGNAAISYYDLTNHDLKYIKLY